tara:strand:+ start:125 stop:454 length:330 start_codon:yes stop_codon:yes gene_type:complete
MIKIDPNKMITDTNMVLFTLSELGCYVRLQCHCWQAGKLPSDTLSLARLAGCSVGELQSVWPKVSQHFEKTEDGKLFCPVLDEARKKAEDKSEQMRKVANARWNKEVKT